MGLTVDVIQRDELARVIRSGAVHTLLQPVIDLASGLPVGAEALSRGPSGPLELPDRLFESAAETGQTLRLDQLCIRRAVQTARKIPDALDIFVNVEPSSLAHPATLRLLAPLGNRLVIEVTERHLARDPAGVLRALEHARVQGARVALDDVGVNPASVALLDFVRPDIIKLDLTLIQNQPDQSIAQIGTAVMAHAERSGAEILAEGIETDAHIRRALALGATLGQGYLLGRPQSSITDLCPTGDLRPDRAPAQPVQPLSETPAITPFAAIEARCTTRIGDIALLLEISQHLETQASRQSDLVLLAAFQTADRFTPATARRYEQLARDLPFVAAIGVDLSAEPAPGVRGATIRHDDPLSGEWAVIAIGPHFCGALIARDLGDRDRRLNRRFEYTVTHHRPHVTAAAMAAMNRITAQL